MTVPFSHTACPSSPTHAPLPAQNKLTKVQGEVDVLVEAAKVMAVEVEQKVASANVFAEQVGIEKEKVNAENGEARPAPALSRPGPI